MKNKNTFLLTFLLVSIIVGVILYLLFRKPERVIIYKEQPEILFPFRHPIDRPWWDFGGLPMKPTTPSLPPPAPSQPAPAPPAPAPAPPAPAPKPPAPKP